MRRERRSRPGMRATMVGVLVAVVAGAAPAPVSALIVDRLSFLHVGAPRGDGAPQILDDQGRSVLLRGVAVNGLEDYYSNSSNPTAVAYPVDSASYEQGRCPMRNTTVESIAVCDFDAAQMHAFGYDVVRLGVSWSQIEPSPGQISQTYLDRIAQVVGWLRAQGIYSVIDMHQDAWSKYLYTATGQSCPPPLSPVTGPHESDGAPEWASAHLTPVCQVGAREVDPAVQEDFQRLWSDAPGPDGVGLQEHFAQAVLALAQRFQSNPAVAGYDLFNEPSPGFTPPPGMDTTEVFPFYAKIIQTVRDRLPGFGQLFFIEPDVTRDVTDQRYAFARWSTFSSYGDVVYAPHIYTHVFTPDAEANAPGLGPLYPVSGGYASAEADAQSLGIPLWDGEFGTDVSTDETTLREHYSSQDALGVGGALWVWKADGTAASGGFSAMQGPFGLGTPFPSRVKFSDRAYPIYTAGALEHLAYDPDRSTFDLRATSAAVKAGDRARATVIYLPASSPDRVHASGAGLETTTLADGGREVYAFPRGGPYRVFDGATTTGAGGGANVVGGANGGHHRTRGPRPVRPTRPENRSPLCVSRRRFAMHLTNRRGRTVISATAWVRGRTVGRERRGTGVLVVDLRGVRRGTQRVRITERVRQGGSIHRVVFVRVFHTCARHR